MAELRIISASRMREAFSGFGLSRHIELAVFLASVYFCSMNYLRSDLVYFTLADLLFLLSLCFAIANASITFDCLGRKATVFWLAGLVMMLFGLIASSLPSAEPIRGLIVAAQYFYAYAIVLVVVGSKSLDDLVLAAKVYVFSIVTICLHGVYLINVVHEKGTDFVSGSGRFNGLMERENECAAVIALAVPLLLLLVTTSRIGKVTALICGFILLYGLLLTGSNTGLLGLVLATGTFMLFALRWKAMLLFAAGSIMLITVASTELQGYLPAVFQKRVLVALETSDISQAGTFESRVKLMDESLERTGSTMLLGVGADQYRTTSAIGQPVHNVYLLLWTEGGFISVVGFVLMLLSLLGPAYAAAMSRNGRIYAGTVAASLFAFVVMANGMPHMYGRFWAIPLLLPAVLAKAFAEEAGILDLRMGRRRVQFYRG